MYEGFRLNSGCSGGEEMTEVLRAIGKEGVVCRS
jgi:hypothetical protein